MNDTYQSCLDVNTFGRLLNRRYITNSHKYYWFMALIKAICKDEKELSFDMLANEMIIDAWYTVTEYYVHLGPLMHDKETGVKIPTDKIEQLVRWVENNTNLNGKSKTEEIRSELEKLNKSKEFLDLKRDIIRYAPFKLLSPYLPDEETGAYISGKKKELGDKECCKLLLRENANRLLPYTIKWSRAKLEREIVVPEEWREYIKLNQVELMGWIERNKIEYLQDRNPEVPGIVYKLQKDEGNRNLQPVRKLWNAIMSAGYIVEEIFCGSAEVSIKDYEIDHFIPWTFVANNELWNLCPIRSSINLDKSNFLADALYIDKFVNVQKIMFNAIKTEYENKRNGITYNSSILQAFEECKNNYVFAAWANEVLYDLNQEFNATLLKKHITDLYESAHNQGFGDWEMHKDKW